MGHHSCCVKQKLRKGLWSPEEDEKLLNYITRFGVGCWSSVPKLAGLQRCGKSCRLRWINYLRPDLKRGMFSQQEEDLILRLHEVLGNRWAQIAAQLPGRTDNEIKNFWNSCLKKRLLKQGIDPNTHQPLSEAQVRDEENRTTDHKAPFQIPFSITDQVPDLSASTSTSSGMDRGFQMRSASYNVGGEMDTSRDQPMVSKQVFDPLFLLEFQASIHPCAYHTNFLPRCEQIVRPSDDHDQNEFEEGISRGYAAFSSMPTLTNFDQTRMTEADFSDSSTSRMSSLMVNEPKESSSNSSNITRSHSHHHPTIQINKMAPNLDAFSWNAAVNKFESVFEYHVNGINNEEGLLQIQTHNSGDCSNYPLTSLSDVDLSGASLDVLHQI